MKPELYIIECKSNLHVGSGDSNYGVIDKLVQRDTTDELPCIYSSSLKGAFREYFEEVVEENKPIGCKTLSDSIFGCGENKGSKEISKGSHIFQQAYLLSIPLRSNKKPFFNGIAPLMAGQLIEMAVLFGYALSPDLLKELEYINNLQPIDNKPFVLEQQTELEIEDFSEFEPLKTKLPKLQEIIGKNIIVLSDSAMKRLTNNYHLPIIARNRLDNGKSQNLWYEQVVPRQSVFTVFIVNGGDPVNDAFSLNINGKTIQIGGDSSVGYGYCRIYSLPKTKQI